MYRCSVDNAVTYSPEDLILFRESPFAAWMERLTLENPEHGIAPDRDSAPRGPEASRADHLADSLRAEGRDVVLLDASEEEPLRRAGTLDAMRAGADFIVRGTLALGPLSGTADMLMRTSGYSDFGDYLYIPCGTEEDGALNAAFRLCFLADLLHHLQGQLPPQLLVIRGDAEVLPLQAEDHIHYYRAVKARFLTAMETFRKHRMPDPAESSHFGRWSQCANQVLKQRAENAGYQQQALAAEPPGDVEPAVETALADEPWSEEAPAPADESSAVAEAVEAPVAAVASAGGGSRSPVAMESRGLPSRARGRESGGGLTLVEQARTLPPDAFANRAGPGRTPNLAQFPIAEARPTSRRRIDPGEALQNLAFIGSNLPTTAEAAGTAAYTGDPVGPREVPEPAAATTARAAPAAVPQGPAGGGSGGSARVRPAPAPNLREVPPPEPHIEGYEVELIDLETFERDIREPILLPPDKPGTRAGRHAPDPVDSDQPARRSVVDFDGAPSPRLETREVPPGATREHPSNRQGGEITPAAPRAPRPFSDSLITSEEFDPDEGFDAP